MITLTQRLSLFLLLAATLCISHAKSRNYVIPMDLSSWQVTPPYPLSCEMSQDIPFYGTAVFMQQAGKKPAFKMVATSESDTLSEGQLVSKPPGWSSKRHDKFIGQVVVYQGRTIFRLSNRRARMLLSELSRGWFPTFMHSDLNYSGDMVTAQLSAVNFQAAFKRFLICLDQLLPFGFDDIKRSIIYYGPGSDGLSDNDEKLLKRIIKYYQVDPSLRLIQLRGYSDSHGTRRNNYLLSIKRLRNIEQFLLDRGIPEDKIEAVAFGERNPIATNNTAKGRALNRRVSIRLFK